MEQEQEKEMGLVAQESKRLSKVTVKVYFHQFWLQFITKAQFPIELATQLANAYLYFKCT